MRRADGVRSLLEAATLVRDEADLERALEQIARYIAETLGFEVVVTNLYRRAWDDYVVTNVHGPEEIRERLLGCTYERSFFEVPLVAEFEHNGAFLIPEGAYDWDAHGGDRFVPDVEVSPDHDDAWRPGDELFVPFRGFDGDLLGIYCVGQPESGRRPGADELDALVAAVEHAAVAVEAAQAAAAGSRQRRALEHLLRISAGLTSTSVDAAPLQLVVDGIHAALGFLKVALHVVVEDALVPSAFAGWPADAAAVHHVFPVGEFSSLFQEEYEIAGCYLVPDEIAVGLVATTHQIYESEMNGRGRHGWRGDWLLVPLYGREGGLLGVVWADDPADRLRPDEETLKILRMFANHAAAAIEASKDVAALRDLVERLRELDTMKDDFVALVSHELRTPLTSIQGYTELLREDVEDPQQQSFLDVVERSTERLLAVVNDLLLVAQLQAGKVELRFDEVVLADVLEEAAAGGRVAAET
jgi:GAF domain-containing protein